MQQKRSGFWSVYHSSRKDDLKVFEFIGSLVGHLNAPFKKKSNKGRNFKFNPRTYAQYIVFADYKDLSYRDAECSAPVFLKNSLDHSAFGKILKRMPHNYFKSLRRLLRDLILFNGMFFVRFTDSTKLATTRYEIKTRVTKKGIKRLRRKKCLKRHLINRYYPDVGIVVIEASKITGEHRHDSPVFREMLIEEPGIKNGLIFGDAAYWCEESIKLCEDRKMFAIFKCRYEVKFVNKLQEELYKKYRGIAETVFGGYESWNGNNTRMLLPNTQAIDVESMSIIQLIRTYFKMLETEKLVMKKVKEKKEEIIVFLAYFSTTSS